MSFLCSVSCIALTSFRGTVNNSPAHVPSHLSILMSSHFTPGSPHTGLLSASGHTRHSPALGPLHLLFLLLGNLFSLNDKGP